MIPSPAWLTGAEEQPLGSHLCCGFPTEGKGSGEIALCRAAPRHRHGKSLRGQQAPGTKITLGIAAVPKLSQSPLEGLPGTAGFAQKNPITPIQNPPGTHNHNQMQVGVPIPSMPPGETEAGGSPRWPAPVSLCHLPGVKPAAWPPRDTGPSA